MVANYQVDRTSHGGNLTTSAERSSRPRHYDSFVVRLWKDEGSDSMLRVELQHVQAGLSIEAVQVPLDWISGTIQGCLQSPMEPNAGLAGEDAH